jgi:outer membrane receptor protein involved in Fe transport
MVDAIQTRDARSGNRFARMLTGTAALLVFAGAMPTVVQAQEAGAEAEADTRSTGAEIVVTARRKAERLQDVPIAVTALTGANLEQYNVTSVGDIATFVPSMVVGKQVTGSSASIFLRGVGSSALSAGFDQSVSFNIDGLALSRGREINFAQYDLAGVEVLKGPQALYFGRNTTGGLISIRTNDPGSRFEAMLKGGYGFEAHDKYVEGVISGPLSDTFGARLAFRFNDARGSLLNTGGPATDPATGLARAPQSKYRDPNRTISGRLTLKYEPTDTLSFVLKGGYTDYEDDGAGNLGERKCGGGRTTPFPNSGFVDPFADCVVDGRADHSASNPAYVENFKYARGGKTFTDLTSYFAVLNSNIDTDVFDISLITGYSGFKQVDFNDFTGSVRNTALSQFAKFSQFSQEVRLSSDFDGPINVSFGGYYSDSDFTYNLFTSNLNLGFDAVRRTYVTFARDSGFKAKSFSLYAQANWEILPSLSLAGGARWSSDKRDSFQQSLPAHTLAAALFPQNVRFEDNFDDTNLSPEVTLSWKPDDDATIYAAYKQGYKSGGFNISQTITAAASLRAGQFKSEDAKGFEIGTHALLLDRQLMVNAAVYDYDYNNLQVQFYDPITTGNIVANAGKLTTRGFELDFNFSPRALQGFSLRGAYAYNDAKYHDFIGQCYGGQTPAGGCNQQPRIVGAATVFNGQIYSGRTAPKAPKHSWQLGGSYEMPLGSLVAGLSVDVKRTSQYNFSDTLIPEAVQPGFTKLDASLSLASDNDRWKLALIGRNLTNEFVVTAANEMVFTGGTGTGTAAGIKADLNTIVERPREVALEVTFKF